MTPVVLRCHGRRRGQAGVSLVEVLVVTLVVAPLILAASTGLFAAVNVSTDTQDRQVLEAALASYVESLKAMPYATCGDAALQEKTYAGWDGRWVPDPGSGVPDDGLRVLSVAYWDQDAVGFVEKCAADGGAQRLTVQVTNGRGTATGDVVKRDPDATPGSGA